MTTTTTRPCRSCPTLLAGDCAWCPVCQAARLTADRERLATAPREERRPLSAGAQAVGAMPGRSGGYWRRHR